MSECLLNDDIWYHVLRFLSPEDLQQANSCHHVLFEGWMRSRYTTVTLTSRDKAIRLLEHLDDPSVAAFVKKVEICPWLVQSPIKSFHGHDENPSSRFADLLQPYHTRKSAKERLQRRVNEDVSRINAAFKQMKNVTECTIDWDNTFDYHREFYTAALTSGLDTWSEGLVKLTVKVPPAMLNSFARINLPRLESFIFQFSTGSLSFKEINVAHDGFIVFLNNLKDSLQSLAFSSTHSSQDLDLSRIFRKMGCFPLLTTIALSIPADGSHLSDPATFVQFLEKHRLTLEEINLLSSETPSRNKPGDYEARVIDWRKRIVGSAHSTIPPFRVIDTSLHRLRAPFSIFGRFMDHHHLSLKEINLFSNRTASRDPMSWTQRIAASICAPFPQLRGIGISLCSLHAYLDILVKFIEIHRSTLDHLALTDCTLSHSDVLKLFRSSIAETGPLIRISKLQLRVDELCADFLVDLAFLLPNLKYLKIECDRVSNTDAALEPDNSDFIANLLANARLISGWGLQCLEIATPEASPGGLQTLTIDLSEGAHNHFNPCRSNLGSISVSSISSFATARDTVPSLASGSVSSGIQHTISDVSVYSVASSRTNETDYGRFYTRMALSQASIDCDGTSWRSCNHEDDRRTSWNSFVAVDGM